MRQINCSDLILMRSSKIPLKNAIRSQITQFICFGNIRLPLQTECLDSECLFMFSMHKYYLDLIVRVNKNRILWVQSNCQTFPFRHTHTTNWMMARVIFLIYSIFETDKWKISCMHTFVVYQKHFPCQNFRMILFLILVIR